eukprot:s3152_g11.t1
MEICDSVSKMFDFPDFLLMMRRLLDMNFANMNQRLGRVPVPAVKPVPGGEFAGVGSQTLRLPDEAPRSGSGALSARSTQSSHRRRLEATPPAPAIPGSAAGSVYSKAKDN